FVLLAVCRLATRASSHNTAIAQDEDTVVTPLRRTALVAGLLYLATFVAGIPPSFLYGQVLTDSSAVLNAGNDGQILWGVFLDLCTGMAGIGTAVALFSVVKRQHEGGHTRLVDTELC